jgi:glutamate synthase (NADPH/NADH) small chain
MGKPRGFLEFPRETPGRRPIEERVKDWREIYREMPEEALRKQGARCMDCGIPFCHKGCPLGNIIPDWNDLVYRDRWKDAYAALRATNNFPEFTGRVCPAPCEESCVLGINEKPVTIKNIELSIVERAFAEDRAVARPPAKRTGKRVAVVGSGPAGLACADQLNRAGHLVAVLERADRIGGLLTYGIPDFKLEKRFVRRRIDIMREEGIEFRTGCNVGVSVSTEALRKEFDAICLAGGATQPRDLPVPGRDLAGIHFAMEYLGQQNRVLAGDPIPREKRILAEGKRVVILGGGDTGADCLGTAHRQRAASVHQFELLPRPPAERTPDMPWPRWPAILRTSSAHEEGGIRDFGINTKGFSGSAGRVEKIHAVRVEFGPPDPIPGRRPMSELPGSEFEVDVDLVFLALGFLGPERTGAVGELGLKLDPRGNVATGKDYMTSVPGVFAAGDMRRGQSLVVWAILEGREAARCIDKHLMGVTSLPRAGAGMVW